SLELEVQVQIYVDPPILKQQTINVNRSLTIAIPKSPAFKIDSFFVKSFTPEAGYTFQLNLNTENLDLPNLKIEDLHYSIKLTDSITISGKIARDLEVKSQHPMVQIPIHLNTGEMIDGLKLKLGKQQVWNYEATAIANLKSTHPLFENTALNVSRTGKIDLKKIGNNPARMPSLQQINRLEVVKRADKTFLEAEVLLHNP